MTRSTSHIPSVDSIAIHRFTQAANAKIPRSRFDRSHGHKTTFNSGLVIPVYVDEALPGDVFSMSITALARLATPLFPVMDNVYMDFHFFAVPCRLLWSHWEQFNGAQTNPGDSTDYVVPTVTAPAGGWTEGSLADYMGLPTGVVITTNALPFRAYNLIWNQWYRDENLQDSVTVETDDGPDTASNYVLLNRGKRKDYFTSALPWPQKGPAVTIPLGTTAPVVAQGPLTANSTSLLVGNSSTSTYWTMRSAAGVSTNDLSVDVNTGSSISTSTPVGGFFADLSEATAATINSLREAFQVQKIYERDARGGTRYIEILKSHFGVVSSDARLQRPEYLGGGTVPVMVNPVPQTVPAGSIFSTPQGNLAAYGTAHAHGIGFTKSFEEHCYVFGFVSVRADLNYQQGINRMWLRQTRFDFYWPALSHIGEQAVYNGELYAQGSAVDSEVFGYQEAYAEYRYKPGQISGLFRSQATGSLDAWHLAQDFGSLPTLSSSFIVENPPMSRIKAVTTEPDFIFDSFIRLHCARPMPVYSVPGLIDHF